MNALLALFLRSVRAETRSFLTYALRFVLGLLVLVMIVVIPLNTGWLGAPGLKIFSVVIYLDLFVISLAGLSYFASAVAEEKEDMTLGLLRMTNLSPLSILFGKSTSRLVGALLLLAAQVPFTLLAIALGGVTAAQVVAAYACLGAYLFFLANLALVFSVLAARTSTATFFAGCAVVVFWSGSPLAKWTHWVLGRLGLIASPTPGPALGEFLDGWWNLTPWPRLQQIVQTGFHDGAWCSQVTMSLVLGVGFFLLAWALFHRGAERAADPEPKRLFVPRSKTGRSGPRKRRAWRLALVWKDFYFLSGGKLAFTAKCVICVAVAAFFAWRSFYTPMPPTTGSPVSYSFFSLFGRVFSSRTGQPWLDFGSSLVTWLSPLLLLELMFAASRVFRLERRWQTLSTLAVLPMSIRRVAWQKILGCLLGALPWAIFVALGYALTLTGWWYYESPRAMGVTSMLLSPGWLVISTTVLSIAGYLLLLHVIAALSLWLKWGALPLGLVCFYILQGVIFLFAVLLFQQAATVVVAAVECFALAVLHIQIGRRLEELAEED